jgi:hypothetical protein
MKHISYLSQPIHCLCEHIYKHVVIVCDGNTSNLRQTFQRHISEHGDIKELETTNKDITKEYRSRVPWVITLCSSEKTECFSRLQLYGWRLSQAGNQQKLVAASSALNYMVLQSRRYSSHPPTMKTSNPANTLSMVPSTAITWLTYSWSWALLGELPILQPLKNFPAFHGTQRFSTVFARALHWPLS